jgi:hypothetical protein
MSTRLTEHWTLEELCHSNTADKYNIDNTPPVEAAVCLRVLAEEVLEPVRQLIGRPMIPSSGYRCPALNSHPKVQGKEKSQHLRGEALDFVCNDMDEAFKMIVASEIPYDQVIRETPGTHDWIHISYTTRHANRHEARVIDDAGDRPYQPKG